MSRPLTLSEKIIARASGRSELRPGEIVTCAVDLAMMHDSGGPRRVKPYLERLAAPVWDASKVVIVTDHFVPPADVDSAEILALTRRWARDNDVQQFFDMQGICHVVVQERGLLLPGMLAVGGDSHSPSGGAVGAFMVGIGATEMAGVLVTGEIWLRVPETYLIRWSGTLGAAPSAKDIMLFLCAHVGMSNDFKVMQYAGETIRDLSMMERLVLCNMSAELGAKTGIIAADEKTLAAIRESGRVISQDLLQWQSDPDADYAKRFEFDAGGLAPQVAAPHSPANSSAVDNHGSVRIDQAYIGACTGAKLSDLHMAAAVLQGNKVAPGVRLLVAPASADTMRNAATDGTLATLTAAGAILLPSGCGACAGYGAGVLADDEVCIASTARNFKGRMGSAKAAVYLASPYTVAASAIRGLVSDPREFVH